MKELIDLLTQQKALITRQNEALYADTITAIQHPYDAFIRKYPDADYQWYALSEEEHAQVELLLNEDTKVLYGLIPLIMKGTPIDADAVKKSMGIPKDVTIAKYIGDYAPACVGLLYGLYKTYSDEDTECVGCALYKLFNKE